MKKIIRLTEADLTKMIQRVVNEQEDDTSMDDTSMDEHINWDIKTIDCEGSRFGNMSSMGVDKDDDGNIFAFIRYCKGDDEELEYLKRKARLQIKMENQLPSDDEAISENKIMKKIIRLTENDLTRIVRRVISEQASGKFDTQVSKFTKDIASKLIGKQICAEESNDSSNYECYFLDSVKEGPVYMSYDTNVKNVKDIKFINMSFSGRFYPSTAGSKVMKMSLDIGINLQNGVPISVSRTFVFPEKGGELIQLNDEEVSRKTLPLIKGIRVAEPPKPENPCFKGYTWGKVEYMRIPKHFEGQVFTKKNNDRSETLLFKTGSDWSRGTGVIDKGEGYPKKQEINWVCSSGKLTITNRIPTRD